MPINFKAIEQKVAREETAKKIGFFRKLFLFFLHPKDFFIQTKERENSIYQALLFLVPFIIIFAVGYLALPEYQSTGKIDFSLLLFGSFFTLVAIALFLIAYLWIIALLVHGILKLFGVRNPYYQTFKGYVYGLVPFILLAWLPGIFRLVGLVYTLVIQVLGLSINQEIKWWKVLIVSLPLLILDLFILGIFATA